MHNLGVSAEWLGDLKLLICGCAESGRVFLVSQTMYIQRGHEHTRTGN